MRARRAQVLLRDEGGAAAVEFAIVSALFITFVLGIFWLCWGLYCGADVRHGIERASRIYLTNPGATDTQFETAVGANLGVARLGDIGFTITKPVVSGVQVAQIAWTYSYVVSVPFMSPLTLQMGSQIVAPIPP